MKISMLRLTRPIYLRGRGLCEYFNVADGCKITMGKEGHFWVEAFGSKLVVPATNADFCIYE